MLGAQEKSLLLQIARQAVEAAAARRQFEVPPVPESLRDPAAVFVTLKTLSGDLRGCIGTIDPDRPLAEAVAEMARSAALYDPRFPPVVPEEVPELSIEISILSPRRRLMEIDELQPGHHGLIVERGPFRGLLLPQVATEWGWTREEFLAHTCAKAGLPPHAWKEADTDIFVFSAEVIEEESEGELALLPG